MVIPCKPSREPNRRGRIEFPRGRLAASLTAIVALLSGGCQPQPPPAIADGGLIVLGGGAGGPADACFACHGVTGQGDGGATPRLAGLEAGYLRKQLEDYATGLRQDAIMQPISRRLPAAARGAVSDYYASLRPKVNSAAGAGDLEQIRLGARLYAVGAPSRGLQPCAACHGPPGVGWGAATPALGGQAAAYTAEQLRRWRRGERRNDPRGVMADQAQRLEGREIEAVAAFLAGR